MYFFLVQLTDKRLKTSFAFVVLNLYQGMLVFKVKE